MTIDSNKVNEIIEVSLGWVDVISIFSGAASLVMAALAIWLSITFYKMSDASAKEMKESTNKINSNVDKLEKMFDTMYADTFSMVKETVTHMRKQVDRTNNEKEQSYEVERKIEKLVSEQIKEVTPQNLSSEEIKDLIMNLLKESKEIEQNAFKQKIEDEVVRILALEGEKSFNYLQKKILGEKPDSVVFSTFFDVLLKMTQKEIINADFDDSEGEWAIATNAPIKLLKTKLKPGY